MSAKVRFDSRESRKDWVLEDAHDEQMAKMVTSGHADIKPCSSQFPKELFDYSQKEFGINKGPIAAPQPAAAAAPPTAPDEPQASQSSSAFDEEEEEEKEQKEEEAAKHVDEKPAEEPKKNAAKAAEVYVAKDMNGKILTEKERDEDILRLLDNPVRSMVTALVPNFSTPPPKKRRSIEDLA